jgi:hypothetical protein
MTIRLIAILALAATASCSRDSGPQAMRVDVSYMVDTTSAEHREVLDLWRSYLAGPPDYRKTTKWSQAEQERWPIYDLGGAFAYGSGEENRRTRASIFEIAPARPRDSTEYVIRTVFVQPDNPTVGQRIVTLRVYAIRENGKWVLSNALPRLTADWKKTQFGQISYVYPPEHTLDTTRARMTVRFVDSLATVFDAPKPKAITYYLARSPEEVFRINGIEFYLPGSRAYTLVGNYMVFSGVPKYGEFFPHELTHMVLGWVLPGLGTPALLDEALAIWLGGGREMTWRQIRQELAGELRRHPDWTLEYLLEERPATFIFRQTATAALLELAHQRGGLSALKASLNPPRDRGVPDVVGGVAAALKIRPSEVEVAWRKIVLDGG